MFSGSEYHHIWGSSVFWEWIPCLRVKCFLGVNSISEGQVFSGAANSISEGQVFSGAANSISEGQVFSGTVNSISEGQVFSQSEFHIWGSSLLWGSEFHIWGSSVFRTLLPKVALFRLYTSKVCFLTYIWISIKYFFHKSRIL